MTYTYPTDPANRSRDRLRALIQRARTATNHDESLRIAIFGDSTWTCPGGFGVFPLHQLVLRMGELFGNTAGSQMLGVTSAANAPFCFVGNNGVQADPWDATYEPPGLIFGGLPGTGEGGAYPPNWTMDVDCLRFATQRLQMAGYEGFPAAGTRLEVYAAKRANSCPSIEVQYRPTDRAFSLFEAQVGASEILPVPGIAEAAANPELIRVTTQAYTPPVNKARPVWWLRSSTPTTVSSGSVAPVLCGGARVLNGNPVGAIIDTYSAGGYRSTSWFGDSLNGLGGVKGNAADVMAQIPQDIWIFSLGLNDFYNSFSAANTRRNLYDADGTSHKGMIGELIDARIARGLRVPLIVLIAPPFRANDGTAGYAANKAQHDLFAAELRGLVDELQAAGYDSVMRDVKAETERRGFNSKINDFQGCTVRGAYNTAAVEYALNDIYTGTNGVQYKCIAAHTSDPATEPTDDGINNTTLRHQPVHVHLAGDVLSGLTGTDPVHHSAEGATLVVDSWMGLFAEHAAPASTQLSSTSITQIIAALKADPDLGTTGLLSDAEVARTQATAAATQATAAATQTTASAIRASTGLASANLDTQLSGIATDATTAATEATAAHVDAATAATQATTAASQTTASAIAAAARTGVEGTWTDEEGGTFDLTITDTP